MGLEKQIEDLLRVGKVLEPLPTTRELGERFDVSHVTVSRVLRKLTDSGVLWQAHSGRFYASAAKEQLSRPRPVGCLVRSLSGWSAWYERIMTGVSLGCELEERAILVHPVADLVQQTAPDKLATFMDEKAQRKVIERYIQRHAGSEQKLLLDGTWSDAILKKYADQLPPARLILRISQVDSIPSIHPDFAQGALLGLSHLLGLGYKKIIFIQPSRNDRPMGEFEAAFSSAITAIGDLGIDYEVAQTHGTEGFDVLSRKLVDQSTQKTALVCPEDNFAVALLAHLKKAGLSIPDDVGLLAGMGTDILRNAGISSLNIDFVEMGRRAVATRAKDWSENLTIPFTLTKDTTT